MAETMYIQCTLSRKVWGGLEKTTSWIPVKFAVAGNALELLNESGDWINGWVVDDAPGEPMPGSIINNRRPFGASLENRERSRQVGILSGLDP